MVELGVTSRSRRSWFAGGVLLLASAVFGAVIQPAVASIEGAGIVGTVLSAAALVIFAIGRPAAASVTARRPLGTTALIVLAGWTLLTSIVFGFHLVSAPDLDSGAALRYVDLLVQFIAAVIAVVEIGRTATVPHPWNWAPAWSLAAIAAVWALDKLSAVLGPDAVTIALPLGTLDGVIHIGAAIFLGVLAIVLASQPKGTRVVTISVDGD